MKLSECTHGKIVEVDTSYPHTFLWHEVGMVVGLGAVGHTSTLPAPKVHFPVKNITLDIHSSYLNLYEE